MLEQAANVLDHIVIVPTQPFQDQKPGTSGLRKKVAVFQQPNYVENYIQSILNIDPRPDFLIVGGDGRYFNDEVIKRVVSVCVANGVSKIFIPKYGLISTPGASSLIRTFEADGAIILTASHNPGGPEGDLGIKFNRASGGPAPEWFTDRIYQGTTSLKFYSKLLERPALDLNRMGTSTIYGTSIDVMDPISNYLDLMVSIFDFKEIRDLINGNRNFYPVKILIDCMNGVTGPYVRKIFLEAMGAPRESVINGDSLPNFGGRHPDPNLTHAKDLVRKMKEDPSIKFGVAFDGDGDRHMILGEGGFFVSPGDSLAIIAANLKRVKRYSLEGFKGFARSFPTSPAVDRVAKHYGLPVFVTPTGWKYFGNLLNGHMITLCGEESFGVGADHIREKDGIFGALVWLNVMAFFTKSVREIVEEHWRQFGRDYFVRYDYENCNVENAMRCMGNLEAILVDGRLLGTRFGVDNRYQIVDTGDFSYEDPVDLSTTYRQGLYVACSEGARIIFRQSGTDSCGATIRLYLNDYHPTKLDMDPNEYLRDLFQFALQVSDLKHFIGKEEPDVIT